MEKDYCTCGNPSGELIPEEDGKDSCFDCGKQIRIKDIEPLRTALFFEDNKPKKPEKYKFVFYTETDEKGKPTTSVQIKVNELLAEMGYNVVKNVCLEIKPKPANIYKCNSCGNTLTLTGCSLVNKVCQRCKHGFMELQTDESEN